jgi:hypothetical protein
MVKTVLLAGHQFGRREAMASLPDDMDLAHAEASSDRKAD